MFLDTFKTEGLAHNAYLLGDGKTGILVDPRRDGEVYLEAARKRGVEIKYILETHRQEDFVMGAKAFRELGHEVTVVAGNHKIFDHADRKLGDGDTIEAEGLIIRGLATPGHTPESTSYAVFRKSDPKVCWGVFTGDALFVGDSGRTDLTDPDKTAENAGILYDSVRGKILPLGDAALILPAHGAGSVCGGKIAPYDQSTIGYERSYNSVFVKSREEFIKEKVGDRLPRPPYFRVMEEVNLDGGLPLGAGPFGVKLLAPALFREKSKGRIVIDTRSPEAFAGAHIPGSYSVWLGGMALFPGWIAKAQDEIYFIADRDSDVEMITRFLGRLGLDGARHQLDGGIDAWRNDGMPVEFGSMIAPEEVNRASDGLQVLDVREILEFESGHIPGAQHIYVGDLETALREKSAKLNANQKLAVTCSVGHRASLAVSVLQKHGFKDVANMIGGMTAWKALKLPLENGPAGKHNKNDT